MEVAGLVFSAVTMVTLWNTCVQAFDIIASAGPQFGMESEVAFIKLEVERVRLLMWGETTGLANVQRGQPNPQASIDSRLHREDVFGTVMRLLGCIQRVFEDTDSLQKKYGLSAERRGTSNRQDPQLSDVAGEASQAPDTGLRAFGSIFKRAYADLQRSAKDYQQHSSIKKKARWAISDKAKFLGLVAEVRAYNNSLASLFPDISLRLKERLRSDIEQSHEVRSLVLLQQATIEDHADLSDTASVHLTNLGATDTPEAGKAERPPAPYGPWLPRNFEKMERENKRAPTPFGPQLPWGFEKNAEGLRDSVSEYHGADPQMSALEKALEKLEVFAMDQQRGALVVAMFWSAVDSYCAASVGWEGHSNDSTSFWCDSEKGFVVLPHEGLEIYHRKTFMSEDKSIYFDIESDPHYESTNPGTVTIEGFGMECWAYEVVFGKPNIQEILLYSDLPNIPAKKILRRIHELKEGRFLLGWNPRRDYEELEEFIGPPGIDYYDKNSRYEITLQIMDLLRLLHRRDVFDNFLETSSIAMCALKPQNGRSPLWNFLLQIIIAKELARRLEHSGQGASYTHLSSSILADLIVADCWIQNVDIVLVGKKPDQPVAGSSKNGGQQKDIEHKETSDPGDDLFDITGKEIQIHSKVHVRQVDALLYFARAMKWPYLNETREYSEDVYGNLRSGTAISLDLWDWLFGTVLPGKSAASKIMAALVLCTPSLQVIGGALYFGNGLSLPKQSYWRTRTVLGRVLGCLPSVKSVCGWIGPCPPVNGPHHKYIHLQARPVVPPMRDRNVFSGSGDDEDPLPLRPKLGDDIPQWMDDIGDKSRWVVPEAPVRQLSTCALQTIDLKPLPLAHSKVVNTSRDEADVIEYRASLTFKIDNESPVIFTLYTNPVFVTLPACVLDQSGKISSGHPVHTREFSKYHRNVWNVEALKDLTAEDYDDKAVLVINATGKGSETAARAWCSEVGKNAAIARQPGPCFVCAYNVASKQGLGVNVLIWVS